MKAYWLQYLDVFKKFPFFGKNNILKDKILLYTEN